MAANTPQLNPADEVPKRRRRTHQKSRDGCAACKRDRKKCSEERPRCRRCQDLDKPCQWGAPVVPPSFRGFKHLDSRQLHIATIEDDDKRTAFEFFASQTLPILRIYQPSRFWQSDLGYLAQRNSAFRKIVIALGFQQRCMSIGTSGGGDGAMADHAHNSYTQAVTSLRRSINVRALEAPPVLAFGCLLLAILASMRGDRDEMLMHLRSGIDILGQTSDERGMQDEARESAALLQSYIISCWLFGSYGLEEPAIGPISEPDQQRRRRNRTPQSHRPGPSGTLPDSPDGSRDYELNPSFAQTIASLLALNLEPVPSTVACEKAMRPTKKVAATLIHRAIREIESDNSPDMRNVIQSQALAANEGGRRLMYDSLLIHALKHRVVEGSSGLTEEPSTPSSLATDKTGLHGLNFDHNGTWPKTLDSGKFVFHS